MLLLTLESLTVTQWEKAGTILVPLLYYVNYNYAENDALAAMKTPAFFSHVDLQGRENTGNNRQSLFEEIKYS